MANRPTIMGTRHVIAANHYLAAHAGFQILEAGGNAIDAGVAAGIAIGILQGDKVSFGGVAPIMVFHAKTKKMHSIDGLGVWPRAVTPEFFMEQHGGKIPHGVLRSITPAAPDAWITALSEFGTMSFADVAQYALRFAREGYPLHPLMSEFISDNLAAYQRWPTTAKTFLQDGKAPAPGDVFIQPELAKTLQYMIDEEKRAERKGRKAALKAARDAFYKGDIAAAIVEFHRREGGLMTMEDLAAYAVRFEPTVKVNFQGVEVHSCGPWCQGPVVPMALAILKGYDLKSMGHNSPAYIHIVNSALELAFADRHMHFGDPAFVEVPMDGLVSDAYAAQRRELIRNDSAFDGMPPAGDPATGGMLEHRWMPEPESAEAPGPGDTSYTCCIDREGNVFSATPSDGSNTTPMIPGIGIVCSGRGQQSWVDPTHPSSVAPGKRPRLTPSPAIAMQDGKALMPFGTPGGDVQPQAMLQTFLNVQVFGMDPQDAIEAPRFANYNYPGSFEPHPYFPNRLYLEGRIPAATGDTLKALGHKVHWWPQSTWLAGAMCAIKADHQRGVLAGGADPRRPAYVLGW